MISAVSARGAASAAGETLKFFRLAGPPVDNLAVCFVLGIVCEE